MTGSRSPAPPGSGGTRLVPWPLVRRLVGMTLDALDALGASGDLDRRDLAEDPLAALEAWDQVVVRRLPAETSLAPPTTGTGGCNVAGTYYDATASSPAVVAVAEAWSAGRNAFTALHELGHHVQRTTPEIADELGELDREMSFVVEDEVCNRFAAAVLIPDEVADTVFGATNPSAGDVVELAARTSASRAAACVCASQYLKNPGAVVLLDAEDRVQFAATRDLPPLRRGSSQASASVVAKARARAAEARTGFRVTDDECRFTYRDDIGGDALFAQAADAGNGYLVVVAVSEHPPWKDGFVLPKAPTGPAARTRICPHPECGEVFTTWARPHEVCGEPVCTNCHRCACTVSRVKERECGRCHLVQPAHVFDGDSDVCDDCA